MTKMLLQAAQQVVSPGQAWLTRIFGSIQYAAWAVYTLRKYFLLPITSRCRYSSNSSRLCIRTERGKDEASIQKMIMHGTSTPVLDFGQQEKFSATNQSTG